MKETILSDTDITPFLKRFYLKDMFLVAGRAWESVTSTTIENGGMGLAPAFPDASVDDVTSAEFDFFGFCEEDIETAEHRLRGQLDVDQSLEDFITEWTIDNKLSAVTEQLTYEQIISDATSETKDDNANTIVEEIEVRKLPLPSEVVAALEIGLQWVESRGSDYVKVMQISSFLNTAKKDLFVSRSRKQKRVRLFLPRKICLSATNRKESDFFCQERSVCQPQTEKSQTFFAKKDLFVSTNRKESDFFAAL